MDIASGYSSSTHEVSYLSYTEKYSHRMVKGRRSGTNFRIGAPFPRAFVDHSFLFLFPAPQQDCCDKDKYRLCVQITLLPAVTASFLLYLLSRALGQRLPTPSRCHAAAHTHSMRTFFSECFILALPIQSPLLAPARSPLLYRTYTWPTGSTHVYMTALLLVEEGINSDQATFPLFLFPLSLATALSSFSETALRNRCPRDLG